ncbi:M23 family metallopeptidase [Pseudonocardia sp. N23]|uniref:M23 family metallopeptidase n=1 Tax=Pseudonocardia sp. N23 TaxID=1987376 RepID=UPI000C02489F|nr:M23 family metallopeptidase [Pseudonocardia sp. N23]GAY07748.1 phage peptidoglycan binding endopeptidase [Pseudonocardia sp. N23]
MSRHRSPSGRSAHQRSTWPVLATGPGAGGAHRATPLSGALTARIIATVVAGGAVAVTAQAVHSGALSSPDVTALLSSGTADTAVDDDTGTASGSQPTDAPEAVTGADVAALASGEVAPAISPDVLRVVSERGADLVASAHQQVDAAVARQAATQQAAAQQAAAKAAEEAKAKADEAKRAVQIVTGRVSSGFGMRGGAMHAGLDIAAPIGTPIRVPLDGVVISSGPASGFGMWVRVQHADGTITVYGHINRSLVKVGQQVSAGQQIAEVGNRGQSTGPHLHIEVQTAGGKKIDPRPWLNAHGFRYQ